MAYAIVFEFPEGKAFAGLADGAAGFAPSLGSAWIFEDVEVARRTLTNAYSNADEQEWGKVVKVEPADGPLRP